MSQSMALYLSGRFRRSTVAWCLLLVIERHPFDEQDRLHGLLMLRCSS